MHFGQFGGRCKSLQSGKSWKEELNSCYSLILRSVCRRRNELSLSVHGRGGEGSLPTSLKVTPGYCQELSGNCKPKPSKWQNTTLVQWRRSQSWSDLLISLSKGANQILTRFWGFPAPFWTTSNTRWWTFSWTSQTTITQNHNESAPAAASRCFDCKPDMIKMGCRKS